LYRPFYTTRHNVNEELLSLSFSFGNIAVVAIAVLDSTNRVIHGQPEA
jgi:hypothetical protein